MNYIDIIITACIVFPVLAFLITLPYIIYNYNKYGSVLFIRTLLIYSFILYLLSAYFLIILPLPSFEYVSNLTTKVQIIPFTFIKEIIRTVNFNIKDLNSFFTIFRNPFIYQTFYNLFLTMPFGLFLRYYFNCNLKKTLILTFLLSLFFETTQLTGLYFVYPNAYRLFDIDDIIINTLGGITGYLVTPLFLKLLPSKNDMDLKSYKKGIKVSSTKRVITFLIDMAFTSILFLIELVIDHIYNLSYSYYLYTSISLSLFFILIPVINRGCSLAYKITNIKIVNIDLNKAKWYQILFRNIIFCFIYIPLFYYLMLLFNQIKIVVNHYNYFIVIGYISSLFLISMFIFIRNLILHKPFIFEKITKTKVISTIKMPE